MITEARNSHSTDIDRESIGGILRLINDEDQRVALAVKDALPQIEKAVAAIERSLVNGGRLIYIGAGTSGRLGVLDASECPPTYNTPPELVLGLIAGGDRALRHAVEGTEDRGEAAIEDLMRIAFSSEDALVGIAASGATPYVMGALEHGKNIGATTIGISCNPQAPIGRFADVMIEVVVGPEVVSGSTRMKAGTAQKMVLNMLSTATMIRMGKVYKNWMVDMQASNAKLRRRAVQIVTDATDLSKEDAELLLEQADWRIKEVIVMAETGASLRKAQEVLHRTTGRVREAIAAIHEVSR